MCKYFCTYYLCETGHDRIGWENPVTHPSLCKSMKTTETKVYLFHLCWRACFLPNVSSIIWFVKLRNLALYHYSPGKISSSFFLSFFEKLWENWESLLCHLKVKVKVAQLCPTLCDPMDYIVHGILLARILGWVAFPFSRGSSQSSNRTQVSPIAGRFFTSWATREALWRGLCHEEYAIWKRLQMKKDDSWSYFGANERVWVFESSTPMFKHK